MPKRVPDPKRRPVTIPVDALHEALQQFYGLKGRFSLETSRWFTSEDWTPGPQIADPWRGPDRQ